LDDNIEVDEALRELLDEICESLRLRPKLFPDLHREPRGPADQLGTDIISQTPNDLVTATRVSMEAGKRVAS
jgi:hypothetical protein